MKITASVSFKLSPKFQGQFHPPLAQFQMSLKYYVKFSATKKAPHYTWQARQGNTVTYSTEHFRIIFENLLD